MTVLAWRCIQLQHIVHCVQLGTAAVLLLLSVCVGVYAGTCCRCCILLLH